MASATALAGDASTATLLVAGVAGLSGTGLGLALRGYLRPLAEMASPNGWWLVFAIVVGGLLFAAPNGVQLVTVSLLAGFLLACCLVVGRRELALRRRSSV